jgi:hypothetical protein
MFVVLYMANSVPMVDKIQPLFGKGRGDFMDNLSLPFIFVKSPLAPLY